MLLVDLYCPFCKTYSFFAEVVDVGIDLPMFSMAGFTIERVSYEFEILRCILCRRTTQPVDDSWLWLYWYAWWNGDDGSPVED